ncbi:MAG: Eco57I restriction-modification methylase domain-containing protein, partial [Microcystaceae cyanobacterium]
VFLNSPINQDSIGGASLSQKQNNLNNDAVTKTVGRASSPNKEKKEIGKPNVEEIDKLKIEEIGKMPILPNRHFLSGFDAITRNPPFQGGKKITGALGTAYRDYLVEWIGNNVKGNADLVAYFFLRVFALLKQNASCGLVSTNTIAQGDTREVGLDQTA